MYTYTCIYICLYIYIYVYICICICTYMCICTNTYMYIYICIYTYAYICMHISIWTPKGQEDVLDFRIVDTSGNAVYAVTHEFFTSPSALFVLVWRLQQTSNHDLDEVCVPLWVGARTNIDTCIYIDDVCVHVCVRVFLCIYMHMHVYMCTYICIYIYVYK